MTQTHTFHTVGNGTSYIIETEGTILTKVTVKKYQQQLVVHHRIGHPVNLDDIEVNIGNDLRSKSSHNPELQLILSNLKHNAA